MSEVWDAIAETLAGVGASDNRGKIPGPPEPVIVPLGEPVGPGQVREDVFFHELAAVTVRALWPLTPLAPLPWAAVVASLERARERMEPYGSFEALLRRNLGIAHAQSCTADQLYAAAKVRVAAWSQTPLPPVSAGVGDLPGGAPAEPVADEATLNQRYLDANWRNRYPYPEDRVIRVGGPYYGKPVPRGVRVRPPGSIDSLRSDVQIGQRMHAYLQRAYLEDHPNNFVVCEWRWYDGPRSGSIGTFADRRVHPPAGEWERWAKVLVLDEALRYKDTSRPRRPDILDFDSKEVYEIKSRRDVMKGLNELKYVYLEPYQKLVEELLLLPVTSMPPSSIDVADLARFFNETHLEQDPRQPKLREVIHGIHPGLWCPRDSIFWIRDLQFAVVSLACPGVLVYDLYDLSDLEADKELLGRLAERMGEEAVELFGKLVLAIVTTLGLMAAQGALIPLARELAMQVTASLGPGVMMTVERILAITGGGAQSSLAEGAKDVIGTVISRKLTAR